MQTFLEADGNEFHLTFNDLTVTMRAGLSGLATGINDWGMEISWSHACYAWPNNL